jgi:hypothetical protein
VQGCVRRLEGNCLHFSGCGGGVCGWGELGVRVDGGGVDGWVGEGAGEGISVGGCVGGVWTWCVGVHVGVCGCG